MTNLVWCQAFPCSEPCFILRTGLVVNSPSEARIFTVGWLSESHARGKEGGRIVSLEAIPGTKHTTNCLQYVATAARWKTGLLFSCNAFCHLLYSCFPFCPLYFFLIPLSSTFSISLCFHLLFLYTLNLRQSVLTAFFFCLYSLGNTLIFSVPFPGYFLYAGTGTS